MQHSKFQNCCGEWSFRTLQALAFNSARACLHVFGLTLEDFSFGIELSKQPVSFSFALFCQSQQASAKSCSTAERAFFLSYIPLRYGSLNLAFCNGCLIYFYLSQDFLHRLDWTADSYKNLFQKVARHSAFIVFFPFACLISVQIQGSVAVGNQALLHSIIRTELFTMHIELHILFQKGYPLAAF